jgi:hypothetical protein
LFGVTKGCRAQHALLHGGTLKNGKVAVDRRCSHGIRLRELVARIRFEVGDVVTCYGGLVKAAPSETDSDTHMRHIPLSDHVLDGLTFSNCFPEKVGSVLDHANTVSLQPRCQDPEWEKIIVSNGVGYMANTVTWCPLRVRARANVVVLRASTGGIDSGESIISPYEPWKLKQKFQFKCMEEAHYKAAGKEFITEDCTDIQHTLDTGVI